MQITQSTTIRLGVIILNEKKNLLVFAPFLETALYLTKNALGFIFILIAV